MPVITFDFHNTLANCDPWFDLEVRDLPWAVVSHLGCSAVAPVNKLDLDAAYAGLRRRVMDSGDEIDAVDSVSEILEAHGVVLDRRTINKAIDELMAVALKSLEPVAGVIETIRYLHSKGCRLGVISSAVHHSFVEWSLCKMALCHAFVSIVTSASAGYYKSSPRIYERSLRELEANPGCSIHVGDSLQWDVNGARLAGMNTIWLDTGRIETRSLLTPEPVVPDLTLRSMVGAGPIIYRFATELEQGTNG